MAITNAVATIEERMAKLEEKVATLTSGKAETLTGDKAEADHISRIARGGL